MQIWTVPFFHQDDAPGTAWASELRCDSSVSSCCYSSSCYREISSRIKSPYHVDIMSRMDAPSCCETVTQRLWTTTVREVEVRGVVGNWELVEERRWRRAGKKKIWFKSLDFYKKLWWRWFFCHGFCLLSGLMKSDMKNTRKKEFELRGKS